VARLFNKLRKSLIESNSIRQYFKYAVGEIILVVVGILIALQINSWNEDRKLRNLERVYIESFVDDIRADIESIENHREITKINMQSAKNVIKVIRSDKPISEIDLIAPSPYDKNDTIIFLNSISRAGFIWYPEVTDYTFSDLKSSGGTSLIRDKELKKSVFRYYALLGNYADWRLQKDEAQRIYQNIQSGLLDPSLRILSNYSEEGKKEFLKQNSIDLDQIADKLRAHPDLEAALNGMIYSQDRLLLESDFREFRAEKLLEMLEEHLETESE
jgi:hypothetical protein